MTPTGSDANGTLAYLDGADAELDDADDNTAGHQVALEVGANTIKVQVTAEDTTTLRTYTHGGYPPGRAGESSAVCAIALSRFATPLWRRYRVWTACG